ncbi:BTAD domain-containing putative transcriptional regulator [Phytohabitans rumicis]|uniref:BTAD domain-containing putative transcriptional regulator n=1 Tax=Phytohabitans rumicis TaxID=1076125 RepID=UPI001566E77A|nr:BTAD domain-containing putative transcriptional regulator [Phytohabitans rumicis]
MDGVLVDLGGVKKRMVVAALALHAGRPVSVDSLIDVLWGEDPPPTAVPTLHVYVAGVRRLFEPDRPARARPRVVVTVTPGYALRLPVGAVDAAAFDAAVDEAHRRLGAGVVAAEVPARPRLAAEELVGLVGQLDGALASWRGEPYADLADVPAAVAERARLEELRAVALEDRAVARLALGEHGTVAAELEALTARHPHRERLWLLRVLALAGSGRQADALDALRQVRRIFADDLGLDPGAALQGLEAAVLRQDPALIWRPDEGTGARQAPGPVPSLPAVDVHDSPVRWPMVGRVDELAALFGLLDRALASVPSFGLLVGEAGIGKTRLTEELAALARTRGFAVLWGRCSEDEGAPPMWPWVGVLRALADAVPATDLPAAARDDLAELFELLAIGLGRGTEPAHDPNVARFRLWSAATRLLVAASGARPLLIVLDDLHWADPSSLRLLSHLVEELTGGRVAVLTTRRPYPEPTGALARVAELLGRQHALRLDLSGLSAAATSALVEAVAERKATAAEAETLRERTEGNPFFIVELVCLMGDRRDALPSAVTDVVTRRVARLPGATGDVLRTAAVIGRRFDLALLADAVGRDEEAILDDLDPALAAGVVGEEETVDRFRFAHALVRDVVYAGLPAARRARRHAVVARSLSARDGAAERLSEVARHWLAAGPAHAPRAWRAAAAAAAHAGDLCAYEEEAALLAAALEAQRGDGAATPLDRYDLLMLRAEACRWLADRNGLTEAITAAVAEAERMGDVVRVARAAVAATEGAFFQLRPYGQTDEEAIAVLRRVLRDLPPDDGEPRCRALLTLAGELYYGDASAYRTALVEQGMAMARRIGDPALLVWACQTAFVATWRVDTADLRMSLCDEGLAAAQELGDPVREAILRTQRAIVAAELGRIAELHVEVRRARAVADRLRLDHLSIILTEVEWPWLAMRGQAGDVERLLARQRRFAELTSVPQYQVVLSISMAHGLQWRGRAHEIADIYQEAMDRSALPMEMNTLWGLARGDRLAEARVAYQRWGIPLTSNDWGSLMERCQAAEVAFGLGLAEAAAEIYRWLAPYAGRCCTAGFGGALGPVDAFLALAASAAGERDAAARHADDALRLCAEWDIPLAAQWVREQRERGGF